MDTSWPADPDSYVTAAQVAAKLGYRTMKAFYAARPKLDARGFPGTALPRRWRAKEIQLWENWNAARAALHIEPANDAQPVATPAAAPVALPAQTSSPALQRIEQIRRAAGLAS